MDRRIVALLLALMMALASVSALAEAVPAATDVPAAEAAEAEATELPLDTVLATVNGENVTWAQVQELMTDIVSTYAQQGVDFSSEEHLAQARAVAMDYAVNYALLRQEAAKLGLDQLTETEEADLVKANDATWEDAINAYIQNALNLSAEATDAEKEAARASAISYYESQGFNREATLKAARENLLYERVLAEMSKDVTVTDEQVAAEFEAAVEADRQQYENNVGMYEFMTQYYGQPAYYQPSGYRGVTHILLKVDETLLKNYQDLSAKLEEQAERVETGTAAAEATDAPEASAEPAATEEPVTQEQVDAAEAAVIASVQPTVDEIMAKFEAGTDFLTLIDEYGTDPGMQSEPQRSEGYSVHQDSVIWDPAFIKAAFSVEKIGEVSKPVVGSYGVHLVYYLRDVPAGPVELTDAIRAELREQLLTGAESDAINDGLQALTDAAEITYTETGKAFLPAEPAEEPVAEEDDDTENP